MLLRKFGSGSPAIRGRIGLQIEAVSTFEVSRVLILERYFFFFGDLAVARFFAGRACSVFSGGVKADASAGCKV